MEYTEFKTTEGVVKVKELKNNRNFKKGDMCFLPVGFGFNILEVFEDEDGLYCVDPCGGATDKRHIYKSEHDSWDTSLIKELGFRKIKLV